MGILIVLMTLVINRHIIRKICVLNRFKYANHNLKLLFSYVIEILLFVFLYHGFFISHIITTYSFIQKDDYTFYLIYYIYTNNSIHLLVLPKYPRHQVIQDNFLCRLCMRFHPSFQFALTKNLCFSLSQFLVSEKSFQFSHRNLYLLMNIHTHRKQDKICLFFKSSQFSFVKRGN